VQAHPLDLHLRAHPARAAGRSSLVIFAWLG
jgi:hypothetical protein